MSVHLFASVARLFHNSSNASMHGPQERERKVEEEDRMRETLAREREIRKREIRKREKRKGKERRRERKKEEKERAGKCYKGTSVSVFSIPFFVLAARRAIQRKNHNTSPTEPRIQERSAR